MNGGGGQQGPISEGMIQFAGWIVFAVLIFFLSVLALDFIQGRSRGQSQDAGRDAGSDFAHAGRDGLVRALVKKQ